MGRYLLILATLLFSTTSFAATDRIVYHLSGNQVDRYSKAIYNLENLFKDMDSDELDIILVLQGESIRLLDKERSNTAIGLRLATLRELGVSVEVGRANYHRYRHEIDLENPPQLVPNVFSRIIELQQHGYQYLTP